MEIKLNFKYQLLILFNVICISLSSLAVSSQKIAFQSDPAVGLPRVFIPDGASDNNYSGKPLIDNEGKLLIPGFSILSGSNKKGYLTLTRLLKNGDIDTSFAQNGTVIFDDTFVTNTPIVKSPHITIDQLNRILVVIPTDFELDGSAHPVKVLRLLTNGQIDTTFGNINHTAVSSSSYYSTFSVHTDILNRILVTVRNTAGYGYDYYYALRFTEKGQLDTSFGENGKLYVSRDKFNLDIDDNNNLLVATQYMSRDDFGVSISAEISLKKYNSLGEFDQEFFNNTKVAFPYEGITPMGVPYRVKAVKNNKWLLLARPNDWRLEPQLVRFHSDGTVDPSFGNEGKITLSQNLSNHSHFINQGNAYLVSHLSAKYDEQQEYVGVNIIKEKFTLDGTKDIHYGEAGTVNYNFDLAGITKTPLFINNSNDEIVISHSVINNDNNSTDINVMQLTNEGMLDESFAVNGIQLVDSDIGQEVSVSHFALDAKGNILSTAKSPKPLMIRFKTNGELDTQFGDNGVVNLIPLSTEEHAPKLVSNLYNELYIYSTSINESAIAKYSDTGVLDSDFAADGFLYLEVDYASVFIDDKVIYVLGQGKETLNLVLYKFSLDGEIIPGYEGKVIGKWFGLNDIYLDETNHFILLGHNNVLRVDLDGNIDSTFYNQDEYTHDLLQNWFWTTKLITDNNGNIHIIGFMSFLDYINGKGTIVKLFSDGYLDTKFADNGYLTVDYSENHTQFDTTIMQDVANNLLVFGHTNYVETANYSDVPEVGLSHLMRFKSNGEVDNSFNEQGALIIKDTLGLKNEKSSFLAAPQDNYFLTNGQRHSIDVNLVDKKNKFTSYLNEGKVELITYSELHLRYSELAEYQDITLTKTPSNGILFIDENNNQKKDEEEIALSLGNKITLENILTFKLYIQVINTASSVLAYTKGETEAEVPINLIVNAIPKLEYVTTKFGSEIDKVDLNFSEAVFGLDISDIVLSNSKVTNLIGSGNKYEMQLENGLKPNSILSIEQNAFSDYHQLTNQPITLILNQYPELEITTSSASPTDDDTVIFELKFNYTDNILLNEAHVQLKTTNNVEGKVSIVNEGDGKAQVIVKEITGAGELSILIAKESALFKEKTLITNVESSSITITYSDPIATADITSLNANTDVYIDVLANDTDPQNTSLIITAATAILGTVEIVEDKLHYTAKTNFVGADVITYTIENEYGLSASAEVKMTVKAVEAPVTEDKKSSGSLYLMLLMMCLLVLLNKGGVLAFHRR
jgi:uncharacterized delta-60 repeat protein